ncbi:hypothetical protein FOA52_001672 [Chlamydomonas sp. UWO 241]|nr:hypothetical protein FOA52_001672 [Chlamydomonas sp. UWO 241]
MRLVDMFSMILFVCVAAALLASGKATTQREYDRAYANFSDQLANGTVVWSDVYTAFPQAVKMDEIAFIGDFQCLSAYALCSFANCTFTGDHDAIPYYDGKATPDHPVYVANCGCQPVAPKDFPVGSPFNIGSSPGILEKAYKKPTLKACASNWGNKGVCVKPENYNTAPFCASMQPSLKSNGRPVAYDGLFDVISTFNPGAWPANTTAIQGVKSKAHTCNVTAGADGWMALCFSAGCRNSEAWNGMPTTCYCPIYRFKAGSNYTYGLAGSVEAGFSCTGQVANATTLFLQNGL